MILEIKTPYYESVVKIHADHVTYLGNSLGGGKAISLVNQEQNEEIILHIKQEELDKIVNVFEKERLTNDKY